MSKIDKSRVYFPALDGLRFAAFGLVYLFHGGIPQVGGVLDWAGEPFGWRATRKGWNSGMFGQTVLDNGWIGVQLFFILSGFLITTLLLREEQRTGRIDLRAFWMRRILRIWPLYYFVVLITFLIIPWLDRDLDSPKTLELWSDHLLSFLTFGGNWSMAFRGQAEYKAVCILWSVCIEEQFYLFCPLIIAGVRPSRRIPLVAVGMIVGVIGRTLSSIALERKHVSLLFIPYNTVNQLDTLFAGVLLALILEARLVRPKPPRFLSVIAILGAITLLVRRDLAHGSFIGPIVDYVAIWVVGVIWVWIATQEQGWIPCILSYRGFVWLGCISYGLYMYHEIAFFLQVWLYDLVGWFPGQDWMAPIVSLILTIGLAWGSYTMLEGPFLRLKKRWSRVESRPY